MSYDNYYLNYTCSDNNLQSSWRIHFHWQTNKLSLLRRTHYLLPLCLCAVCESHYLTVFFLYICALYVSLRRTNSAIFWPDLDTAEHFETLDGKRDLSPYAAFTCFLEASSLIFCELCLFLLLRLQRLWNPIFVIISLFLRPSFLLWFILVSFFNLN